MTRTVLGAVQIGLFRDLDEAFTEVCVFRN